MSRPRNFRGRPIIWSARYPRIYLPKHPAAMADGMVYIHRLVAWEMGGGIPKGHHVHHRDGNRKKWNRDNLAVLPPDEHLRRHRPPQPPEIRSCGTCGVELEIRTKRRRKRPQVFCSHACAARGREIAAWPKDGELLRMVQRDGAREMARRLGVSDTAVRKRVCRLQSRSEKGSGSADGGGGGP